MCCRIGRIFKLTCNDTVRRLCLQFFCLCNCSAHSLASVCQHNLCTISFDDISSLYTHGFRHNDHGAVSFGRRNGRQSDSGISGCRLNDRRTFFQASALFCIFNHFQRNTIFYASCRIEIFQFCQNSCFQSQFLFDIGKFYQRRLSN